MKVVIDSNRVIAALIKDSTTREILFDKNFDFAAPDYIKIEINTHKNMIIEKTSITENEFDILLSIVFERIDIIPQAEYDEFIVKFKNDIKDPNDVVYMAACAATKAEGIWTHDPHFIEQKKIKMFTNIDLIKLSDKNKLD
ncbi:MAG TPA: PIN domain-containing protein [Candidatus Nanoarchaeia archaeon]|nr:PIN domain-containing protein [Candidatus Nanoarchaeia archaeon]